MTVVSHAFYWLTILNRISLEANWDATLIIPVFRDDGSFVIHIRKSPLRFIIKQSLSEPAQYTASYVRYPPDLGDGKASLTDGDIYCSAEQIADDLQDWLLHTVALYIADHSLSD